MAENVTMDFDQLAGLLQYFYEQGAQAFAQAQYREAEIWWSQCFGVIRQIGGNEAFLAQVLFELGRTLYYLQRPLQGVSCLEASAYLQVGLGQSAQEAQVMLVAGHLMGLLGAPNRARLVLAMALELYDGLGEVAGVAAVEEELTKLGEGPIEKAQELTFEVEASRHPIEKFTVNTNGTVRWFSQKEFFSWPGYVPAGLVAQWQTRCINR